MVTSPETTVCPEKAQNLFGDAITRVPLVIKPPGRTGGGNGVSDALVELVDLPATVEELCSLERDYTHFGRSVCSVLTDPTASHRPAVICEGGRLPGEAPAMELQSRQDPAGLYYPRISTQRDSDIAHGKGIMYRTHTHKYIHRLTEPCELYDLVDDPQERVNRIDHPAYAATLDELRTQLLSLMVETADWVPSTTDPR